MVRTTFSMAIAFGLTLLLPSLAAAEVKYTANPQGPGFFLSQQVDIDGAGTDDFLLEYTVYQTADEPPSAAGGMFGIQTCGDNRVLMDGDFTAAFDAAITFPVSPAGSQTWEQSEPFAYLSIGNWSADLINGTWTGWRSNVIDVDESWLAVEFEIDQAVHQGYIHFGLSDDMSSPPRVFGWAYSTTPAPEPASAVLLLTAAALALGRPRRRARA